MLLVTTDPLVLFADLQDGRSGDVRASCRAAAFATECVGDLRVSLTITPQLMDALHHRGIACHLTLTEDRRDDHTLGEMPTHPDDLHLNAIGSRARDNDSGDQAPQQGLALFMTERIAMPQIRKRLAQVEQLTPLLCCQGWFARLMGTSCA